MPHAPVGASLSPIGDILPETDAPHTRGREGISWGIPQLDNRSPHTPVGATNSGQIGRRFISITPRTRGATTTARPVKRANTENLWCVPGASWRVLVRSCSARPIPPLLTERIYLFIEYYHARGARDASSASSASLLAHYPDALCYPDCHRQCALQGGPETRYNCA